VTRTHPKINENLIQKHSLKILKSAYILYLFIHFYILKKSSHHKAGQKNREKDRVMAEKLCINCN